MAATASPAKSTSVRKSAAKRAGAGNLNAPRWTDKEIKVLLDAVAASPTAKAGFETASKSLGKTVGTVQQKYYALKRKENGGRKRKTRKPARSAAATRTAAAPRKSVAVRSAGVDVASMSNVDLSKLVSVATSELQRRMVELEANVRKLLG